MSKCINLGIHQKRHIATNTTHPNPHRFQRLPSRGCGICFCWFVLLLLLLLWKCQRYCCHESTYERETSLVLTCEQGCLKDVRLLVEGHDVAETGMSVKAMVNKEGKCSYGESVTPLAAACWSNHPAIMEYLVRECKAPIYGSTFVFFCQLCDSADLQLLKGHRKLS